MGYGNTYSTHDRIRCSNYNTQSTLTHSTGAIAVQQSAFGEPAIDPILLDDVQCDEMNTNLLDCDIKSQGRTSCSFGETAGVICKGKMVGIKIGFYLRQW